MDVVAQCYPLLKFYFPFNPTHVICYRRQKAVTVDPMVFACVAMMSRAIGPKISKEVKDLLEPMLSVGLRYPDLFVYYFFISNTIKTLFGHTNKCPAGFLNKLATT